MVVRCPWFSIAAGRFSPRVSWRDAEGPIHMVDGPDAFTTWREAGEVTEDAWRLLNQQENAMKLRELRRGPMSAWPPTFGGAYGAREKSPVGPVGTLKAVQPSRGMPGIHVEIEYEGRSWTGMMQWDGKPSVKRMVAVLEKHVGEELRTLGDIEVG